MVILKIGNKKTIFFPIFIWKNKFKKENLSSHPLHLKWAKYNIGN